MAARGSRAAAVGLGPLESSLLELLWAQERAVTVRHIRSAFPALAYTTLMTTLDRLYRKGLLVRHKDGRAFAYAPRCTRDALLGELAAGHVTELLGRSGQSAVCCLPWCALSVEPMPRCWMNLMPWYRPSVPA
jgi:predicted transcriptional regulator